MHHWPLVSLIWNVHCDCEISCSGVREGAKILTSFFFGNHLGTEGITASVTVTSADLNPRLRAEAYLTGDCDTDKASLTSFLCNSHISQPI